MLRYQIHPLIQRWQSSDSLPANAPAGLVIVHRNDRHLGNTDYWSRLGVDLCFDLLLCQYLQISSSLLQKHKPITSLPMLPENMPYYCGPRFPYTDKATEHLEPALAAASFPITPGAIALANHPVQFCLSSSAAGLYHPLLHNTTLTLPPPCSTGPHLFGPFILSTPATLLQQSLIKTYHFTSIMCATSMLKVVRFSTSLLRAPRFSASHPFIRQLFHRPRISHPLPALFIS